MFEILSGILSTAQKKGLLLPEHKNIGRDLMVKLNKQGEVFAKWDFVATMTDVTGFGLLGHLSEICEGSKLSAVLDFENVPKIPEIDEYIAKKCIPGGTNRNWDSYGHKIAPISDYQRLILADPQTSGGLLVAVEAEKEEEFLKETAAMGLNLKCIGQLVEKGKYAISLR